MSTAVWSSIAAAVSIGGLWLAGANPRTGWITGIVAQTVWAAYGVITAQPGMIALYAVLYSRNLWQTRGVRFPPARRARPRWRRGRPTGSPAGREPRAERAADRSPSPSTAITGRGQR
jgi:hypothetical protein